MPSLTCFNLRFTPSWLTILCSALFIFLFLRLGFWQIQRAEEKKTMVQNELTQAAKEPIDWNASRKLPTQYERIKFKGHFLSKIFLLDNQHHQHQFGYDVLTPLLLADNTVILVDRGWVIGDSSRSRFPDIQSPKKKLSLQGSVYFPSKNKWILGENMKIMNNRLSIIESIDIQEISQILQKKVYPFIMRLDTQDPNGFVREWSIVSMPYQRHLGYAFQWFAMAFAILILFLALNLKRQNEQTIP